MKRSIIVVSSILSIGLPACAQGNPFEYSFDVTATKGGGFSISAVVDPPKNKTVRRKGGNQGNRNNAGNNMGTPANTGAPALAANPPTNPAGAATQAQVQQVTQQVTGQITDELRKEQRRLINQLQQQQQQLVNQLTAQNTALQGQVAQLANQQGAQAQLQQQLANQLNQQQNFMANAYTQFLRDRRLRDFERRMINDPYYNPMFGNTLGSSGQNQLLNLIRDMMMAGQMGAFGNQQGYGQQPYGQQNQQMPTADEIAQKLQSLMSEKLSDDAAKKVLDALKQSGTPMGDAAMDEQLKKFEKLNEQLAGVLAKSGETLPQNLDDYERLAAIAAKVDDVPSKKLLLEMSLEAAGRVASDSKKGNDDRQNAKTFATRLVLNFQDLKKQCEPALASDVDFDIDKCLRIGTSKDFYSS
ncbi:MAG: hypothetical protein K2Z81_01980 [Cyanobacteria bacterium]|nr:hypothetical protein [Cyanobacteriota bacterium]